MRNAVIEFPTYEVAVEYWPRRNTSRHSNCDNLCPLRISSSSKDTRSAASLTSATGSNEHHQAEACDSHLYATARC